MATSLGTNFVAVTRIHCNTRKTCRGLKRIITYALQTGDRNRTQIEKKKKKKKKRFKNYETETKCTNNMNNVSPKITVFTVYFGGSCGLHLLSDVM